MTCCIYRVIGSAIKAGRNTLDVLVWKLEAEPERAPELHMLSSQSVYFQYLVQLCCVVLSLHHIPSMLGYHDRIIQPTQSRSSLCFRLVNVCSSFVPRYQCIYLPEQTNERRLVEVPPLARTSLPADYIHIFRPLQK